MSDYSDIELREVDPSFKISMSSVEKLLLSCGLKYEPLEYMAALFDQDNTAVACGGYSGNTVKCLAVKQSERGSGLLNTVISHLIKRLIDNGNDNITVFTKPENEKLFVSLGFKLIARAQKAVFMERGKGLERYLKKLSFYKKDGVNGAIVMNCNPFTKGHLYLAEYASRECDNLYVFVVSEDKSVFPTQVRFDLVKRGLSHLDNVTVIEGGPYIISRATFPSYFIKEYSDVTKSHTEIDVGIFGEYISPLLNIKRRFVGEESTDKVTSEYNKSMERLLQSYGMDPLIVIPRKTDSFGEDISASRVRKWIADDEYEKIREAVPGVTYEFLRSKEGMTVIERIKNDKNS